MLTTDNTQWQDLQTRGYVPHHIKSVAHEARNGLLMCGIHQALFDVYAFYVRYDPNVCIRR